MNEPTIKQWKRRALKAEEELEIIQGMRQFDAKREMDMARELAVARVALREVQEVSNWAYGTLSQTLGVTK
jgi:hypothetical protein